MSTILVDISRATVIGCGGGGGVSSECRKFPDEIEDVLRITLSKESCAQIAEFRFVFA